MYFRKIGINTFRPCVNLSCDHDVVVHDPAELPKVVAMSQQMPFILETYIVGLHLSLVTVRRTVLQYFSPGREYASGIVFFLISLRIAKTVSNSSAQHAVGYIFQIHSVVISMSDGWRGSKDSPAF